MDSRPVVVVLAAGKGSRFTGTHHKLGQDFAETTVLGSTLRHVLETGLELVVVTTDAVLAEACRYVDPRCLVVLPQVGQDDTVPLGMGYSIASGVSARSDASGWVILPGDMPMIEASTIRAVAAALDDHPVAYASYRGRRGHPVGFAAELYSELSLLGGDAGASRLVSRYPSAPIEVDDPGVLIDIDTEGDLQRARDEQAAVAAARSGV